MRQHLAAVLAFLFRGRGSGVAAGKRGWGSHHQEPSHTCLPGQAPEARGNGPSLLWEAAGAGGCSQVTDLPAVNRKTASSPSREEACTTGCDKSC